MAFPFISEKEIEPQVLVPILSQPHLKSFCTFSPELQIPGWNLADTIDSDCSLIHHPAFLLNHHYLLLFLKAGVLVPRRVWLFGLKLLQLSLSRAPILDCRIWFCHCGRLMNLPYSPVNFRTRPKLPPPQPHPTQFSQALLPLSGSYFLCTKIHVFSRNLLCCLEPSCHYMTTLFP